MSNEKIEQSKKNKPIVTIHSSIEEQHLALPYAKNMYSYYAKNTNDEDKKKAFRGIKNAFIQYLKTIKNLDEQNEIKDFPTLQYEKLVERKTVTAIDDRIVVFVALLGIIAKNQTPLPEQFDSIRLQFDVPGWPVSAAHPYFTDWAAFIQKAAAFFKDAMPNSDLSSWLPKENQLNVIGSSEAQKPVKQQKILTSILKSKLHSKKGTTPEPGVTSTSQPEMTSTSQPEMTSTPQPEMTSTPQPEMTSTPQPEMTSTPQPELTSTPIVAPDPKIVNASVKKYDFDGKGWAPRKLNSLLAQLKNMHQYGLQLESEAPEKSIAVMKLSVSLSEDLKQYYQNKLRPTAQEKQQFLDDFHLKLHSKDELMSTHRKQWQVIVANIAIALTVIGLLAIGISLLARGHAFFNETKCQKLINDTDEKLNNTISVNS